jgi:hypothetical protein
MKVLFVRFTTWNMAMEVSLATLVSFILFPFIYTITFDTIGYLLLIIELVSAALTIISSLKLKSLNRRMLEENLREGNRF